MPSPTPDLSPDPVATDSPDLGDSIPLARPALSSLERRYVRAVMNSTRLALGPWLDTFEQRLAAQCGTRHAIAVSSGTAALHLIVRALGLGEGDEVLTTPFSFVASSNALLYEGVRPRFADIDPETYNLDAPRVEAAITPATRAILAVDVFGEPADWPALTAVADRHDLLLIDDACEALGASIRNRPIGTWGDAAAFGFYPNKQITTGEGGCVTTDADDIARLCRSLRNQGRADDRLMYHPRLGYNYRMSELAAALGCAQLERLPDLLDQRATVARHYQKALAPLQDEIILPTPSPDTERSWFVYVIRLRDHFAAEARDRLMNHLHEQGIGCASYFPPIHLQPYYRDRFGFTPGDFPVCERIAARTLALPFYPALTQPAITRVAETLKTALADMRSG